MTVVPNRAACSSTDAPETGSWAAWWWLSAAFATWNWSLPSISAAQYCTFLQDASCIKPVDTHCTTKGQPADYWSGDKVYFKRGNHPPNWKIIVLRKDCRETQDDALKASGIVANN